MRISRPARSTAALLAAVATTAALLTACQADDAASTAGGATATDGATAAPTPEDPVAISSNVRQGERTVPVDRTVEIGVSDGRLARVAVRSKTGKVAGSLSADGQRWVADGRLEPDTRYTVTASAEGLQGGATERTIAFRTQALTLDEQAYPSVAPLDGETVGIGMPVIVTFDLPVEDKAAFERHMKVTSQPAQRGSWYWLSDQEAHWRPAKYWQPGTDVTVDVDVNSVSAGGGIYGQEDREVAFHVGDAHVYRVDARTHRMKVFVNGSQVRDLPITTGKEGFATRSGTKVIIEKFASKRMRSETVGIGRGNPEYYDIDDVQWAMRLTYSGEFIHAAPWSVGSQGYANVSHGCTGMSTSDAKWLYDLSRRGDVVEYSGTDRWMTLTNGYGDWNESFADYRRGSALS